ncbi:MAG: folylpolyglutamate synthase/dihydrofolate synthase family protein [Candidatus Margulisiibacteriota bacterium]
MLDFDTKNIHLGLERVEQALKRLGDPHLKFPAIHVAGTNGKGSVCSMLDSILGKAGYKVGLFTSPHLLRWNERIKVNGHEIPDEVMNTLELQLTNYNLRLTPFEIITCIAFEYFARQNIDMAVVEVGMGGRLDATNVVNSILTIITNVELDHTEYLGGTIEKIRREKEGIIKPGVPHISPHVSTSLHMSNFVEQNRSTVVQAVSALQQQGYKITDDHVKDGIASSKWPGRFQIVPGEPLIILDGAHNPAGARALKVMIKEQNFDRPITLVIGVQASKDADGIMRELTPLASRVIITRSSHPQSAPLSELSVEQAIKKARSFGKDQIVLIAGSLFVVADALKLLIDEKSVIM